MDVIVVLIVVSLSIASGFAIAFYYSFKSGQYDDVQTPAIRMLFENKVTRHKATDAKPGIHTDKDQP